MIADTILKQIQDDIHKHQLELPSLPDIAIRIRESVNDPKSDIDKLGVLIQRDPALVVHLLHIANSPLFRGESRVEDVTVALNRLGLETTSNVALTYAMKSLYSADLRPVEHWLKKIWKSTTHLAALSSVLAKHCPPFEPGKALVAALMQDIGCLPLIAKASLHPALFEDEKTLIRLLEKNTTKVGVYVMESWDFDKEIIDVIKSRKDWMRDVSDKPDYADLILVARLHRYMGTKMAKKVPAIGTIPAFKKLALGNLSASQSLLVLDEAKQEVCDIQKLLRS